MRAGRQGSPVQWGLIQMDEHMLCGPPAASAGTHLGKSHRKQDRRAGDGAEHVPSQNVAGKRQVSCKVVACKLRMGELRID